MLSSTSSLSLSRVHACMRTCSLTVALWVNLNYYIPVICSGSRSWINTHFHNFPSEYTDIKNYTCDCMDPHSLGPLPHMSQVLSCLLPPMLALHLQHLLCAVNNWRRRHLLTQPHGIEYYGYSVDLGCICKCVHKQVC